jgi:hypothetical protein
MSASFHRLTETVCVVCWGSRATADDATRVLAEILDMRRKAHRAVACVFVFDASFEPPDERAREVFVTTMSTFDRAASCCIGVVQRDATHHRVVVGSLEAFGLMMQVPWAVFDRLNDALAVAGRIDGSDPKRLVARAAALALDVP